MSSIRQLKKIRKIPVAVKLVSKNFLQRIAALKNYSHSLYLIHFQTLFFEYDCSKEQKVNLIIMLNNANAGSVDEELCQCNIGLQTFI